MNRITSYFVKHPVVFWSVVAGIIVAGVLSFIMMPKLEDPPISAKQAMVVVSYPGAPAHEVELKAVILLEDALRALPDVHKVTATCQDGLAMITVEFKMTVLNDKLQEHFAMLRHKVQDISAYLPQDCRTPMVIDDMTCADGCEGYQEGQCGRIPKRGDKYRADKGTAVPQRLDSHADNDGSPECRKNCGCRHIRGGF